VARILAISDEVDEVMGPDSLAQLAPDLIVSCGDLPFEYLEFVVTMANVPLVFVPGNHDPDLRPGGAPILPQLAFVGERRPPAGPEGCTTVDGRIVEVAGLRVGGLGGCIRYREGPNQYTQAQMHRRALGLELRSRFRHPRRRLDILVAHAPPLGVGDDDDPAHRGVAAFHRLVARLSPRLLVHGHIHPHGRMRPDRRIGATLVVNAVGHRLVELES
jgi:hypothetical protein